MRITGLLFACLLSLYCVAQDMTSVFGNMPNNMILLVDSIQRQDLMDLYKDGKTATIKDKLNEAVTMTSFNDDFLELKSGNSSIQIALLNLVNNSKIVLLIQTVCAPVCDSQLKFFTQDWEPLETSDFIQPKDFSWFIKDNTDTNSEDFINAVKLLDMNLMQYSFNPENKTLTQTYTTPQYLSKEDKKNIEPYLKLEPKIFEWKKMRFD
ncbi:MAG: DUF3256 family protein [Candidatus Azobacteroides sp.]|nr:DUF3256 family protein [Candidatus Azobacteroides sp.]